MTEKMAGRGSLRADADLGVLAEALHYFGAHNHDSPRHQAWVLLDERLGPARSRKTAFDHNGCTNGPDEEGNWPCDPLVVFGGTEAECQVCGRVAAWDERTAE